MAIRQVKTMPWGNYKYVEFEIDGPGPAGATGYQNPAGFVLTAAQLGLNRICGFGNSHATDGNGATPNLRGVYGYLARDRQQMGSERVTFKITTTLPGATEVADDTDLAAFQFRLWVWGY